MDLPPGNPTPLILRGKLRRWYDKNWHLLLGCAVFIVCLVSAQYLTAAREKERERIFVDCLMRTATWVDDKDQPVNGQWELCWKAAAKHKWLLSPTAYEAVK